MFQAFGIFKDFKHSQNFKLAAGVQDGVVESLNLVTLKIPDRSRNMWR